MDLQNSSDFEALVIKRSHEIPVLVDFWASWCGPCLMLKPILEDLAENADGRWDLVKIDTDAHQDISANFGIRSLPTVMLFKDGAPVDQFMGSQSEGEILNFLGKHLSDDEPDSNAVDLSEAQAALENGNAESAVDLLEPIEEKTDEAWFLLAQAYLGTSPAKVPEASGRIPYDSEFADRSKALESLAAMINAANLAPEGEEKETFRQGVEAAQKLDFETALQSFIKVIESDKSYADGSAIEGCKVIFQFLGIRHEIAERFHRQFL